MIAKVSTSQDNLWVAAGDGQLERVKELLDSGIEVNSHDEFGYTAMHAAVSYNQAEIVKYLIERGATVDIEDFDKDTPLYVAETVDIAQLLLDNGANPKHVNDEGVTPALNAYQEGWEEVAELLAGITKEELPKEEEETADSLAHTMQSPEEEEEELSEEMNTKMQEIIKKIEEQGGVQDEEELREMVTKMILEEMQKNINNQ